MSKKEVDRMDRMSLPQHKHCPVCGKSMGMEGDFCSADCEQKVVSRRKAQKRSTWIMIGIIGIILLLFWVIMPLLLVVKPGR